MSSPPGSYPSLRQQLLTALDINDDGETTLSEYVGRLTAARNELGQALDRAEQDAKAYRAEIQRLGEITSVSAELVEMPATVLGVGQQIRLEVTRAIMASSRTTWDADALNLDVPRIAAMIEGAPIAASTTSDEAPDPVRPTVERDHPISCDS